MANPYRDESGKLISKAEYFSKVKGLETPGSLQEVEDNDLAKFRKKLIERCENKVADCGFNTEERAQVSTLVEAYRILATH